MKVKFKDEVSKAVKIQDVKMGQTFLEHGDVYLKTQMGAVRLDTGKYWELSPTLIWGKIELVDCPAVTFKKVI